MAAYNIIRRTLIRAQISAGLVLSQEIGLPSGWGQYRER